MAKTTKRMAKIGSARLNSADLSLSKLRKESEMEAARNAAMIIPLTVWTVMSVTARSVPTVKKAARPVAAATRYVVTATDIDGLRDPSHETRSPPIRRSAPIAAMAQPWGTSNPRSDHGSIRKL